LILDDFQKFPGSSFQFLSCVVIRSKRAELGAGFNAVVEDCREELVRRFPFLKVSVDGIRTSFRSCNARDTYACA
jgi:hypothetical protein